MTNEKKILVIEDERMLSDLISEKLRSEGFAVETGLDGEEGLKKMEHFFPDLILLDLILPGMDGYTFLSKIRADERYKKIVVVIFSNLGQREDIKKAMDLGANDYMVKANFTPSEILEKVRAHLSRAS